MSACATLLRLCVGIFFWWACCRSGSFEGQRERKASSDVISDPKIRLSGRYQSAVSDLYVTVQVGLSSPPPSPPERRSLEGCVLAAHRAPDEVSMSPVCSVRARRGHEVALVAYEAGRLEFALC